MPPPSTSALAYQIDASAPLRIIMAGIRSPQAPFVQQRRKLPEFIAFLVIKGEIELTDEMPDGVERLTVRPGEVHVVAPGVWQASTRPFPSGIVFLWFHFTIGNYRVLDSAATDDLVRVLHQPAQEPTGGQRPQRHWLIPRHLDFGDALEDVMRAHTALLENERLWGMDDRGSQAIGADLVYRLHRSFVQSRLRGRDIMRRAPEIAHVARAREFIRLHHERPISLAKVASAIDLNPAYLSRCFAKVARHSVGEAIMAARIETAKRLLIEGHSVKEAAFHSGFASATYFCRRFRCACGTTPLEYSAAIAASVPPIRASSAGPSRRSKGRS